MTIKEVPIQVGKKKKRKRSIEAKARRLQKRVRTQLLPDNPDVSRRCDKRSIKFLNQSRIFKIGNSKAIFISSVFEKSEVEKLCALLDSYDELWEFKKDKTRGPKKYFTTGEWNALGHHLPNEPAYPAGKAGKMIASNPFKFEELDSKLKEFSTTATKLVCKHRPDIVAGLNCEQYYGIFHLFIAPRGESRLHKDKDDKLSFLILLKSDGKGGELELGGTKFAISWKVGDVIILDSASILHGSRNFEGDKKNRIVGDFIIKKNFNGYSK